MPLMGLRDWAQMARNFYPPPPAFLPKDYPSLTGKVVIVTGGNAGLGVECVKLLVEARAKVYIFARNKTTALKAIEELKLQHNDALVEFIEVDLSDLTTIRPATERFFAQESRLDIVIHNAGVMLTPIGSTSKQGYELQLGTNIIGPFALQKLLTPMMHHTASQLNGEGNNRSRIIWVTSSAHAFAPKHGVDLNDLNDVKRDGWGNYGQSKAANIIMASQWSINHPEEAAKIVSISVDPGNLNTNMQLSITGLTGRILDRLVYDARYGAYALLFAALSPQITTTNNGAYIIPWGRFGRVRGDVAEAAKNEIGAEFYKYLEDETGKYL
ncbi:hypothetical protein BABINDRAFT_160310 [Babjeviella inositovora NRRL Y-12698]|uniref:Ketoreductase (KR) domain-containing protein n=1 Tax=Babjeviella inositovora NRRL Y-12698 TaxID=984486 RepID=A0A1E3QWW6_9ASCO|nr:uncharacterized protein BABINDRAFT_160310 [Babjeviella inositovora NRRL Y-12698]ODQ82131.1 hypothetical protein BABINDRAFT_160310 [Babjeviella inositovora NRRL Y-12698]